MPLPVRRRCHRVPSFIRRFFVPCPKPRQKSERGAPIEQYCYCCCVKWLRIWLFGRLTKNLRRKRINSLSEQFFRSPPGISDHFLRSFPPSDPPPEPQLPHERPQHALRGGSGQLGQHRHGRFVLWVLYQVCPEGVGGGGDGRTPAAGVAAAGHHNHHPITPGAVNITTSQETFPDGGEHAPSGPGKHMPT